MFNIGKNVQYRNTYNHMHVFWQLVKETMYLIKAEGIAINEMYDGSQINPMTVAKWSCDRTYLAKNTCRDTFTLSTSSLVSILHNILLTKILCPIIETFMHSIPSILVTLFYWWFVLCHCIYFTNGDNILGQFAFYEVIEGILTN